MAKIKFLTDSASDIPDEVLEQYPDIEVIPFPIQVGGETYYDRVSMSPEEFYELIDEESQLPSHAQITPFQFSEIYEKSWKDGYTHLIYVSINGRGSATYQNALQQSNSFFFDHPVAKGKIEFTIIDSKSYTLAYGFAVVEGAKLANAGKEPAEVIAFIKDWVKHSKILFVPFSLKNAKKSGRVTATTAFVGEALGMRPVMTFKNGESAVVAKVRGEKNVVSGIVDLAEEDRREGAPYCVLCTSMEDQEEKLIEVCTEEFGEPPAMVTHVGCAIAVNAGTQTIGIMYRKEGKDEDTSDPWKWHYVAPKEDVLLPGYIR